MMPMVIGDALDLADFGLGFDLDGIFSPVRVCCQQRRDQGRDLHLHFRMKYALRSFSCPHRAPSDDTSWAARGPLGFKWASFRPYRYHDARPLSDRISPTAAKGSFFLP